MRCDPILRPSEGNKIQLQPQQQRDIWTTRLSPLCATRGEGGHYKQRVQETVGDNWLQSNANGGILLTTLKLLLVYKVNIQEHTRRKRAACLPALLCLACLSLRRVSEGASHTPRFFLMQLHPRDTSLPFSFTFFFFFFLCSQPSSSLDSRSLPSLSLSLLRLLHSLVHPSLPSTLLPSLFVISSLRLFSFPRHP